MSVTQSEDSLVLLAADQARARICGDPCADRCFLASVSDEGEPAVRTLVLRGLEADRVEVSQRDQRQVAGALRQPLLRAACVLVFRTAPVPGARRFRRDPDFGDSPALAAEECRWQTIRPFMRKERPRAVS